MNKTIQITLTSANMGDVAEIDFDCWRSYVDDTLSAAPWLEGYEVTVEQARFGEGGDDVIIVRSGGALSAEAEATLEEDIGRWLGAEGWDGFCGSEWETRRAAREAA